VGRAERREHVGHEHLRGERLGGGEPDPAGLGVALALGADQELRHAALHSLGVDQERAAGQRGARPIVVALEQGLPERTLEGRHAARDRGLVGAEGARGVREAAGPGHGQQHTEVVPAQARDVMHSCIMAMHGRDLQPPRARAYGPAMTDVLILLGHPDPQSFSGRMADAYGARLAEAGLAAVRHDLAALRFDPVLRHGYGREQPLEPDLVRVRDDLLAARHVVWVFPMWWVSAPALVKGLVDRLFTPGFAFAYRKGSALPERLLRGRSARFITTMDAPNFWYTLVHRRALHSAFVTGTLGFVGFGPIRTNTFYGMRQKTLAQRERVLDEVRAAAEADARALARRPRA